VSVAFGTAGTMAGTAAGVTFSSSNFPASTAAGDGWVATIAWGNDADTALTVPAGWLFLRDSPGGTGTYGTDTGTRHESVYWRIADATDAAGTSSYAFTNGGGTSGTRTTQGAITRYTKTLAFWLTPVVVIGSDNDLVSNYSATMGSDPGGLNGDHVACAAATIPNATNETLALNWTGVGSPLTITNRVSGAGGGGAAVRNKVSSANVTSTSSAAPVVSAPSQVSGPAVVIRLRDTNTQGSFFPFM
jgi:hypothetical protein